jgi:hypothetical protein
VEQLDDLRGLERLTADACALREMEPCATPLARVVQPRDGRDPRVPR